MSADLSPGSSVQCERILEVEAWFDGRLDADAARDFEAHAGTCDVCRAELAALEGLRQTLRDATPAPNTFAVKRLRRSLLLRARGSDVESVRPRPRIVRLLPLLAALFVAGIGFAAGALYVRAPASEVELVAGRGASYSTEDTADRHVVRIADGVFDFDVQERADHKRLLVIVPDGEIEDIGTRFRVVVANGVTTEVSVSAGEVELRRRGVAPVRLVAGMSYHPVPTIADASLAPASSAASSPAASASAASASASTSTSAVPVAAAAVAVASPSKAGPSASIASVSRSDSSGARNTSRSEGASAGSPERATPAAASSVGASAGGVSAEDQAYLRVLQLLRDARDDEARAAANDYLARFPGGLRSKEMGDVARRR